MHKRRIAGLVIYGKRKYTSPKTQKFQTGGVSAFAPGYNWREDPYELMLMEQKAAEKKAKIMADSRKKTSTGKTPDYKGFTPLSGGLAGSTRAANAAFKQMNDEYLGLVQKNGVEWLDTLQAQAMHTEIVNRGALMTQELKAEKTQFDEANKAIKDEDREVFAISTQGNVMVRYKDPETGAGIKSIAFDEYTNNVDKYEMMKVGEVANWKRDVDTSMNTNVTTEFLQSVAVGENTLYSRYIKGKEGAIQYNINKERGKIGLNEGQIAPGMAEIDTKVITFGLDAIMRGNREFYNSGGGDDKSGPDAGKRDLVRTVVNSIYGSFMSGNSDRSVLEVSLKAELLADNRSKTVLYNLKTPKERDEFIQEGIKALLVSKIIDDPKGSSGSGSGSKAGSNGITEFGTYSKASTGEQFGNLMALADGTQNSTYTGEAEIGVEGKDRVIGVNMPMRRGAIEYHKLNITTDPKATPEQLKQNNLLTSTAIGEHGDVSDIYTPDGGHLKNVVGKDYRRFITNHTTIAPSSEVNLILMPYDKEKNEFIQYKAKDLAAVKMNSRRAFIKQTNELDPEHPVATSPEDLLPGNIGVKAAKDYERYLSWLSLGADLPKYREEAKDKSIGSIRRYKQAKLAADILAQATSDVQGVFGNKSIYMQPVLSVDLIVDGDAQDFEDNMKTITTKKNYATGSVTKATSEDEKHLEDVAKIDMNMFLIPDNPVRTTVFVKATSIDMAGAQAGEKIDAVEHLGVYNKTLLSIISSKTGFSTATEKNTFMILAQ